MTDTDLLTMTEVTAMLKLSRDTIYRRIKDGGLPVVYVGAKSPRFRRIDVEQLATPKTADPNGTLPVTPALSGSTPTITR